MSRIATRFRQLAERHRKALIPYITAGDPEPAVTVPLMHAMVEAGADLIELGVPFSDTMADGPVIQAASERALVHHVSLRDVLEMVREFRSRDTETPVIIMGYLNPVEVMGYAAFAEAAEAAGVDGVLTVDLPPEEAGEFLPAMREHRLDTIFLLAPTSTPERVQTIAALASGFVYYVSVKGVTGAGHLSVDDVAARLAELRKVIHIPIGVGFGISDARSAARIAAVADAVVVGSAIVKRIARHVTETERIAPDVCQLLGEMRQAMDAGSSY